MDIFKGYVKTKNKKCTQKFANGEKLLSLDEAKQLDEYAGIINNGIILIDIDDEKESELLMNIVEDLQINCRVYQTTRGKHFYFKNNTVKKELPITMLITCLFAVLLSDSLFALTTLPKLPFCTPKRISPYPFSTSSLFRKTASNQ